MEDLSVELLTAIGQRVHHNGLSSMVLVNRQFNQLFTPLLYNTVAIYDPIAAEKHTRTLSSDPATFAYGRDLPSLVNTFRIQFESYYAPPSLQWAQLADDLLVAVKRMSKLQHFALDVDHLCSPKLCTALVTAADPLLRSFAFRLEGDIPKYADGSEPSVLVDLRPILPQLTSISLRLSRWCDDDVEQVQPWLSFFEHVFTSRAEYLRSVKVNNWDLLAPLLSGTAAWPHLDELAVGKSGASFTEMPHAPNLRSLSMISNAVDEDLSDMSEVPRDAFPRLEALACPGEFLHFFFPQDGHVGRPVRVVRLDQALYDEDGGDGGFDGELDSGNMWELQYVVDCLLRSTGPVKELSLYVPWLDADDFWEVPDGPRLYSTLERLILLMAVDPSSDEAIASWGRKLFAHAPNLHTFVLSDGPYKATTQRGFYFAQNRVTQLGWLHEWDKHTNALKKVAFTTDFTWRKTESRWEELGSQTRSFRAGMTV
ncbi:hypothetical protein C8Q78DRAFT_344685 [Trametes maxima]|nr:hypothetical protein C8Q78DRAFT_344685 [Trametes maxima]